MNKKVHVFTSAAFNYIPKVRMLFNSLRKHHPDFVLHLALADDLHPEVNLDTEPLDYVLPIADLSIPDWKGWSFCHNIVELSTAIKPFVLQRLLERPDCEKVIYLDPDMVVFSRLDDILEALDHSNLVLTPHQTSPEISLDAVMNNEICSLKHGVYNLGFFGVAPTEVGKSFAKWWSERVYHFCRDDIPNGLFTDQRWIDLVPAFFEGVAIMRSSRHNVATWNLTTRYLSGNLAQGILVDGEPLGFYHFTGFDSGAHRVMASKNAGGNQTVFELINWYTDQTKNLSKDPLARVSWAFGSFSNGEAIHLAQRVVYRVRVDLQKAFPNPFDSSGFLQWWKSQGPMEYPELFSEATINDKLRMLQANLTPGFCFSSMMPASTTSAFGLVSTALYDLETRKRLFKRTWEVLRTEGYKGILRRL